MNFRTLYASEIECRVGQVSAKGCSLLLYKDARVDMNLLDEVIGAENWQRKHDYINGALYCSVGIKADDGSWVWKQDVGTESNTEAKKGEASDSFKRACVNWGIGRELYTAPFIWITPGNYEEAKTSSGKLTTYTRFRVKTISYSANRSIATLTIINEKTGKVVYTYGAPAQATIETFESTPEQTQYAELKSRVLGYFNRNFNAAQITAWVKYYKKKSPAELTEADCRDFINKVEEGGKNINE